MNNNVKEKDAQKDGASEKPNANSQEPTHLATTTTEQIDDAATPLGLATKQTTTPTQPWQASAEKCTAHTAMTHALTKTNPDDFDGIKGEWSPGNRGHMSSHTTAEVHAVASTTSLKDVWNQRHHLAHQRQVSQPEVGREVTMQNPTSRADGTKTDRTRAPSLSPLHQPGAFPVSGNRAVSDATLQSVMTPSATAATEGSAPIMQATLVWSHSATVLAVENAPEGRRHIFASVSKALHVAFASMLVLVLHMAAIVVVVVVVVVVVLRNGSGPDGMPAVTSAPQSGTSLTPTMAPSATTQSPYISQAPTASPVVHPHPSHFPTFWPAPATTFMPTFPSPSNGPTIS